MIRVKPNTIISFKYKKTTYDAEKGTNETWVPIEFSLIPQGESYFLFPAQWTNAYGAEAITAQSLNVKQPATVRMGFNPLLYEKLVTAEVKIFKGNANSDKDAFMLYGSVDNVGEKNQVMEFKVQRYEIKA